MKRFLPQFLLLPFACLFAGHGCRSADANGAATTLMPQPLEAVIAQGEGAFEEKQEERKAWMRERHKAPPEIDWRAVERENGLRQIAKRNAIAQQVQATTAPRWRERGSDNQAGRMHVVVPASDGQHLYAGSALGGVWKGTLDGSQWQPLGDNLYGGAHSLAAVPGLMPGDPDALLAATDGGLVHVTRDEGLTWEEPVGLEQNNGIRRVVVTSDGTHTVYVLRQRPASSNFQLVRSTDGMASFVLSKGLGTFAGDVWVPRTGGNAVYLLSSTGVQKSTDGGTTFVPVGPAPTTGMSGGWLVGSEAGAPRLWVVANVGSQRLLFRSDDAGASWVPLGALTDFWDGSMNASLFVPDLFAYGGVECHITTNAGASFQIKNGWGEYYANPATKLHADIPGIDVLFDGVGEVWYVNTDGGLFASTDLLASVQNLSLDGLRVSQYYTTLTSSVNPDNVLAGAQDQGYQRASTPPGPDGSYAFQQLISGDYGHLTSADGDHGYVFSTYPGFVLCQVNETLPKLHTEDFPPGETLAWMPPVVADVFDERDFFLCATRLWRYEKVAFNWTASLYSTFDFSAGHPGTYMSALAFSPVDPNRAYAATNDGRLFRSLDHGLTWTQSASIGPAAHYFYGTAIVASALDVNTVYVGGSGYGSPAVYRSTNGGVSWQAWGEGLPNTLVYSLAESRDGKGTLVCGTETAAYRRDAGASAWVDVTENDAPVTIYWSVEALAHENSVRFGTYGRGIWDYALDAPPPRVWKDEQGQVPHSAP